MDLRNALDALAVPAPRAPAAEWNEFQEEFARVVNEHRDLSRLRYLQQVDDRDRAWIEGLDWDQEQVKLYMAYLRGTALLLDCLKLATVGNRREIEARLLLPAGAVSAG